jgi:hypothetical protein
MLHVYGVTTVYLYPPSAATVPVGKGPDSFTALEPAVMASGTHRTPSCSVNGIYRYHWLIQDHVLHVWHLVAARIPDKVVAHTNHPQIRRKACS